MFRLCGESFARLVIINAHSMGLCVDLVVVIGRVCIAGRAGYLTSGGKSGVRLMFVSVEVRLDVFCGVGNRSISDVVFSKLWCKIASVLDSV